MENIFKIYGSETEVNCIFTSENDWLTDFTYLESYAVGILTEFFEDKEEINIVVKTKYENPEAIDIYRGRITLVMGSGSYEMLIAIINACYKIGIDLSFVNPIGQHRCELWSKFY